MISFRRSHRKKVQIDVDWLLGPAPTAPIASVPTHVPTSNRRRTSNVDVASVNKPSEKAANSKVPATGKAWRSGFLFVVSLVGVGGAVAFNWDAISKQALCWEWNRLLQLPDTNEETLEAIVALSETAHDSNRILVSQLGKADATRRAIAFQILKDRVERLPMNPSANAQRIALSQLLQTLSADDRELVMMRGVLASRLLAGFGEEVRGDAPVRQSLNQWIAASSDADPLPQSSLGGVAPTKIRLSDDADPPVISASSVTSPFRSSPTAPSLASSERGISRLEVTSNENRLRRAMDHQPPVPPIPKTTWNGNGDSKDSSGVGIVSASTQAKSGSKRENGGSSRRLSDSPGSESMQLVASQRSGSSLLEPSTVRPATGSPRSATESLIDLSSDATDSEESRLGVPRAVVEIAPNPIANDSDTDESTLRGIRKLTQDKLMRLLESRQDRIVTSAAQELQRRGVQSEHLELGLELARGSAAERLQAMDQLVRVAGLNPVPWLVWMAESSDREVRLRAVSLLGSTADEEALQKLRQLKKKESDNRVVEQINQVLLAADSARSNHR